ncbi:MAG: type II toxin-antitoxin system RelE/ParE family toxin [Geminicoccaceae bacterium]
MISRAALGVRTRIEQSLLILKDHPLIGRETGFPGLHKWSIPALPYAAYYRIDGDRIRIARVIHGARKWPDSLTSSENR